jgi:CheY-like chemotaxis protein
MKVLFVDDYTESSEVLADLATSLGHEARTAETAARAMDVATAWSPDLVVMDVKLGVDDGRDVCRAMRV